MSVTEQEATAPRRWSAFVCPECRFIFRMPGDHEGEGIACPSCRRLLRIPMEGEKSAPLMVPLQKIGFAESYETIPRGEKRTRSKRKKKSKEGERPAWDTGASSRRSSRDKEKHTLRFFVGWTLAIMAMMGITYFLIIGNEPKKAAEIVAEKDDFEQITQVPLLLTDEQLEKPIELPKIMQRNEAEFISLAQPIAESFLTAVSVEQILPLVWDVEHVKAKILAYYPDGKIKPTGLLNFNTTGLVSYKDSYAAVTIQTANLDWKQIAFVEGADGLKIDWESWVGWSEMPWDKLIESRPTSPVLVRAMLKWVDYYNFDFSDESKWRSYQLVSPDDEHTLFGYTERNSLLDQVLRPIEKGTSIAVTLKIRFPEGGESRNQVVIDECIADGWVLSDVKK